MTETNAEPLRHPVDCERREHERSRCGAETPPGYFTRAAGQMAWTSVVSLRCQEAQEMRTLFKMVQDDQRHSTSIGVQFG